MHYKIITQYAKPPIHNLFVKIADFTIALFSPDPEMKIGLLGATREFLIDEGDPDLKVQAKWGDLSKKNGGKMIFDSGFLWKLYLENDSYEFRFTSPPWGVHPYKIAIFDQEFTTGEVTFQHTYSNRDQSVYPLEYPLDELMINSLLAKGKGVEVHACGVVDFCGNGHLFVGQSEAGKTTIARLWEKEPGTTVLSDDRIILRKRENTIWMYGTPWHGEAGLASPAGAPLTKVYFLNKGHNNELVSQKPANSVSRLFACCFPQFYNHEALDFTLSFLEGVVKNVPCFELSFKPDKSVIELIQEGHFN